MTIGKKSFWQSIQVIPVWDPGVNEVIFGDVTSSIGVKVATSSPLTNNGGKDE